MNDKKDSYLGLLSCLEDVACFGYITNTKIKFILICSIQDSVIKDAQVKQIMSRIHDAYLKLVLNVFHDPNIPITNKEFIKTLEELPVK